MFNYSLISPSACVFSSEFFSPCSLSPIQLLHNGSLENTDANRKARRILEKLFEKDVLPNILFIRDVDIELRTNDVGGFGSALKGKHEGQPVALQVIHEALGADVSAKDSLPEYLCRKALAWWSLSRKSVHSFLGFYEENSCLYLVSPYMTSQTLTEWRKNRRPGKVDICKLVSFPCSAGETCSYALDARGSAGASVYSLGRHCPWQLKRSKYNIWISYFTD